MRSRRQRQLLLIEVLCLSLALALSGNTAGASATTRAVAMLHEQLQFTIQAGGNGADSAGANVLKPEAVGGRHVLTLDRSGVGRTAIVPIGTLIFLHFGSGYHFTVTPAAGVLAPPSGQVNLPKNVNALLMVMGAGTATIAATNSSRMSSQVTNSEVTNNWSGYEEHGPNGAVTEIAGSWTVPAVFPAGFSSSSSTWIGIDGDGDGNLIQVGTEQRTDQSSGVYYGAWWEILPAHPTEVRINYPVAPGDHMSAVIRLGSNGLWTIIMRDQQQHWTFVTYQQYDGPRASAEWIMEAPQTGSVLGNPIIASLPVYSPFAFDGGLVNGINPRLSPGGQLVLLQQCVPIYPIDCLQVSTPSGPDYDGDGFAMGYGPSVPSTPPLSTCPVPVQPGDLNGDGVVDLTDLSIIAADWERKPRNGDLLHSAYSDINCDGVVDLADFSIFAANWHKQWHAQSASSVVMGAATRPAATGSNGAMQDAPSATMDISPSTGTFNVGDIITASLVIDGGGQAFNAAQATVNVTGPAIVQGLTPGDCGFSFAQAPTTSDPSFPGAILGGTSTKCTVYTLTLRVTGSSPVGISLSDAAVIDPASNSDILSSVTNATYNANNANAPTDTPQPSATGTTIPTAAPNTATPTGTPAAIASGTPTAPTVTDIPPTFTPTPTATATPTNTNTPVPPTSTPTDTPSSTPTNTPTNTPTDTPTNTPTDSPTNTAIATPTSAPTGIPTAPASPTMLPPTATVKTPVSNPQHAPAAAPTALSGSLAHVGPPKHGRTRTIAHQSRQAVLALAANVTPRAVASGRWLTVAIRTTPRAHVSLLLQLPVKRTMLVKKGARRVRATRTVWLRLAAAQGTAGVRGRFSSRLHVGYAATKPVKAMLTATAWLGRQKTTRILPVTIQRAQHHVTVQVSPRVLVGGRPLTVAVDAVPRVPLALTLRVVETRVRVTGTGRAHKRVTSTAPAADATWHGRADTKGRATHAFHVPPLRGKTLTATLTVTASLPHGVDVQTIRLAAL